VDSIKEKPKWPAAFAAKKAGFIKIGNYYALIDHRKGDPCAC